MLRHSICNEVFEDWKFSETCKAVRCSGYTGIEIAPFTLGDSPANISPEQRREYRQAMEDEGLAFVGLHWLMAAPQGLHVTTSDEQVRARSWEHFQQLIDLCGDLGPKGVMVFGSPKQRKTTPGVSRAEATKRFQEGFAQAAPHALDRGVTLLIEALPVGQSDVVLTLGEAVEMVREIGHPAVRTMFDVHNAVDELESHAGLVDRYFEYIAHVHVNEIDGSHCGMGNYDFGPVLRILRDRSYAGWVSLEAFNFAHGAERIANESLRHLERELEKL